MYRQLLNKGHESIDNSRRGNKSTGKVSFPLKWSNINEYTFWNSTPKVTRCYDHSLVSFRC